MNERLVTAQGASIDLEWRNGAPWCNPRCIYHDGQSCEYRPATISTAETMCLPAVQAMGHQVTSLKDQRIALRAKAVKT